LADYKPNDEDVEHQEKDEEELEKEEDESEEDEPGKYEPFSVDAKKSGPESSKQSRKPKSKQ
jgi:hypothetical protein